MVEGINNRAWVSNQGMVVSIRGGYDCALTIERPEPPVMTINFFDQRNKCTID
jgi:hypothetical protein